MGHSAHVERNAVVHYRWHPLFGRRVRVFYSEQRSSGVFVQMESAPGVVVRVPAWIFDPVVCAGMKIGQPQVSLLAMVALNDLLICLGLRQSSSDDEHIVEGNSNATKESNRRGAASTAFVDPGLGGTPGSQRGGTQRGHQDPSRLIARSNRSRCEGGR